MLGLELIARLRYALQVKIVHTLVTDPTDVFFDALWLFGQSGSSSARALDSNKESEASPHSVEAPMPGDSIHPRRVDSENEDRVEGDEVNDVAEGQL